jgi:hypothetical protein
VLELYKSPKEEKRLFAIQYNRFLSQSTTWWLSPVGVNPAYKYGKFGFVPSGDGEIRIGLYVEKGLGRESQCPTTQVMDSTWFWHAFLNEMETDRFSSSLNSIQSESGVQPEIYIESFVGSERDSVSFLWESSAGRLSLMRQDFKGATLASMDHVSNLPSLVERLRGLTSEAFVWIDLMVGIRAGLNGGGSDAWDAWAIEKNLLQHLEPWVR